MEKALRLPFDVRKALFLLSPWNEEEFENEQTKGKHVQPGLPLCSSLLKQLDVAGSGPSAPLKDPTLQSGCLRQS